MVGYKQTDIGLIPEDWKVRRINSITSNIIDFRGVTPKKKGMEWGDGDIVALSAGNVKKGYIDFNSECYFGSEELYQRWMTNGDAKKNDIVFTMEAPLGNVALIPDDNKYILSQRTILLQIDTENYHPKFIFQIFLSDSFQTYINNSATGSTAKGLKRITFEKLHLPLPPLPEQEAIAEVLSDTDALIGALEKRIAKKRLIKQGAMQKLLTPKDGWEVSSFSELFDISAGGDIDKENYNSYKTDRYQYPIYSNSLENQGLYGYSNQFKNKPNCITITGRGSIGYAENRITPFTAIIRLLVLSPKKNLSTYFFTAMINEKVDFKLESTGVPQLTAPQISNYRIPYPPYKEQETISEVLSDMDNEINALEKKLSKTKELKQGLMQQLLTGKIRLV